jgi:hypothetical protein
MKKMVAFLTLVLSVTMVARADEIPHMDFVKALRAKNYTDLALGYLDMLEKKAPPELAPFIPLERANIHLEMALSEMDMNGRARLFTQARNEFEAFAKKKAGDPLASIARIEAGRIQALQARSEINQLYRRTQLNDPGLKKPVERLHEQFLQAANEIDKAGSEVDTHLKKNPPAQLSKALEAARKQADLELGITLLDQGMCYEPLGKGFGDRGKMIESAVRDLKGVAGRDPKGTFGPLGRAWIIKSYAELDQTADAKTAYGQLMADTGPHAEQGHRMGRYFYFNMLTSGRNLGPLNFKPGELPKTIQTLGEDWIRLYPGHLTTPEGIAVQAELANYYRTQAKEFPAAKGTVDPRAKALYDKALALYKNLGGAEHEYSRDVQSGELEIRIGMLESTELKPNEIPLIRSYAICMDQVSSEKLRIQKEEARLYELKRKESLTPAEKKELEDLEKNLEKKRLQHIDNIRGLLFRALEVADPKVATKDLAETKATLSYVLFLNDDLARAAVLGESVAQTMSDTPDAPKAAGYALQAYARMIAQGSKDGTPKEMVDVDRARFKALASYMEKRWENSKETDVARLMIGMQLLGDQDYRGAEEILGRVSNASDSTTLIRARYRQAAAAQRILKNLKDDNDQDAALKKRYQKRMVDALDAIPTLAGSAPPDVTEDYVMAKLMHGSILYETKQFTKLDTLADDLLTRILSLKDLPPQARDSRRTVQRGVEQRR